MDVKKYTEFEKIFEFQVPNVKLDEFLYNIKILTQKYTKIVTGFYNTYEQYVDIIDKRKHKYKINDISGDILNSERVVFKSMVFDKDDVEHIRDNIVTFGLSEFYSDIPDTLNIFGIDVKPLSFINKEAVKFTLEQTITFDTALNVITQLSEFNYEGERNGFYIWSDKKKNQTVQQ